MLEMYEESVLKGMEAGMFAYLAHPDLFINSYKTFDEHCARISRRICRKAYRTGLPLEYNVSLLGYREERGEVMFPHPDFWKSRPTKGVRPSSAWMRTTTGCLRIRFFTNGGCGRCAN